MTDRTLQRNQMGEAISRMRTLGLGQLCIDDLHRGVIWASTPFDACGVELGAAAPCKEGSTDAAIVRDARRWLFEQDADAFPYHYILTANRRACIALFVGGDSRVWPSERPLRQPYQDPGTIYHIYCARWDVLHPELSGMQMITVRSLGGGLVRLA